MQAAAERVSQAEYARRRMVSRQRINDLRKDGRVVVGDDGLVDVAASDRNLVELLDRSRANRERQGAELPLAIPPVPVTAPASATAPAPDERKARADGAEDLSYWAAKGRREAAEAELAEIKLAERRGALVPVEQIRRAVREAFVELGAQLQSIPAMVAPVIAPQDPQGAERVLQEHLAKVTDAIATKFEHLADEADERPDERGGAEGGDGGQRTAGAERPGGVVP
jgi:hypothetical protein